MFGEGEDIANAVVFLAGETGKYISGAELVWMVAGSGTAGRQPIRKRQRKALIGSALADRRYFRCVFQCLSPLPCGRTKLRRT